MKKTKALLACLTAIVMTASILTGCGGTVSTSTSEAKTDASGKTTLTLWHYFDGQQQLWRI